MKKKVLVRRKSFPIRKTMGKREINAVVKVLQSDKLSGFFGSPGKNWLGGVKILEFEAKWAKMFKVKNSISVNSWTTGLITAIGAIGIEPGDEVIVSPYTMSASASAILFYGGIPIFADIDPSNFNISIDSIKKRISSRTKAIMVVHIFGQVANMTKIMALAKKHNLSVIEDAAQAPFVKYKGRYAGTIGHIGGFSLNYHKHIHTGEGGIIVTNDSKLALRSKLIRNHGENIVEDLKLKEIDNLVGSNYRLTEIQAAIGIHQLDRIESYISHRKKLAKYLSGKLEVIKGLEIPKIEDGSEHAYYIYPIKFNSKIIKLSRRDFVKAVNALLPKPSVWEQTGLIEGYVKPLYLLPLFQKKIAFGKKGFPWSVNANIKYSYASGLCPVAERMHFEELIYTPLVREPLSKSDIDDLVEAIKKTLSD